MSDKKKKKQMEILRVLNEADEPLTSIEIAEELIDMGYDISERTVRFYLKVLDQQGMTENLGKFGRRITEKGSMELTDSRILEKVGFFSARIDQMTYRMNLDITNRTGTVVVNMSLVKPDILLKCAHQINQVYEKHYAMGRLLALFGPGERVGHIYVPQGKVGICTVCSITLNGVLLEYGIPTNSRFGGLLEMERGKPKRFVEIISYDGTTIDPLEVFIKSGMTNYKGAITDGNGRIGASFREFPAESRKKILELGMRMEDIGLGSFLRIGRNGQPLMEIPVSEGRIGAIVIGGLNPVSILEESGYNVYSRALAGLVDFNRLIPHQELEQSVKKMT